MKSVFILLLSCIVITSCKTRGAFGKKSLHEEYGNKLNDAGLQHAALGRLWFHAAEEALAKPVAVSIPFRQVGYFPADKPLAVGLSFQAKRGQKLSFQLKKNPSRGFVLYGEIWKMDGGIYKLDHAADTAAASFEYEIDETGTYLFRLQPELLQSGDYELSISIGPSMQFPVASNGRIGSLWGAPRDGGARSHEGIDIFAPKRTPVVATSDGVVSRVTDNEIGGKVLFLRPEGKSISVYYAHLDEQLVSSGQRVKAGDTLGLVGNTGNARTTPPHLHLGIYTSGGAIDPLAFVDPAIKKPKQVSMSAKELNETYRLSKDIRTGEFDLKKNTPVVSLARNTEYDWVVLPDNRKIALNTGSITRAEKPLQTLNIPDSAILFEMPSVTSPKKTQLPKNSRVEIIGSYGDYHLVRTAAGNGWIAKTR